MYSRINERSKIHLLLEYAQNGSLFEYMQRKRKLKDEEISMIFFQLCQAIQYLHSFNILHRDIKLENVLFDRDYNAKLADFGFACKVDAVDPRSTVCGTREYFAPELFRQQTQGLGVDIWCLGILLYELCHNRTPFNVKGKSFPDAIKEQKQQKYRFVYFYFYLLNKIEV